MQCPVCNSNKDENKFYKTKKGKYLSWCKDCFREYRKTNKRKESVKKYRLTDKFKEQHKKQAKLYSKKYPEKIKAHNKVRVIKVDKCENCDSDCKIQKHHSNYLIPLKVIALCEKCHKALHRKEILCQR